MTLSLRSCLEATWSSGLCMQEAKAFPREFLFGLRQSACCWSPGAHCQGPPWAQSGYYHDCN